MTNRLKVSKLWIIPLLATLVFSQSTPAHAGWFLGLNFGGGGHHGRGSVYLPRDFITIGVSGHRYYYSSGVYYQSISGNYVIVPAPVGAVVYGIPMGYRQVIVNGVVYYQYNGTYYVAVPGGYQVVPSPVVFQQAAPVFVQPSIPPTAPVTVTPSISPAGGPEYLTINVPNSQGGYTAVTLKRSGSGFIGPQGEFYPEFPQVEQLRVMYGK